MFIHAIDGTDINLANVLFFKTDYRSRMTTFHFSNGEVLRAQVDNEILADANSHAVAASSGQMLVTLLDAGDDEPVVEPVIAWLVRPGVETIPVGLEPSTSCAGQGLLMPDGRVFGCDGSFTGVEFKSVQEFVAEIRKNAATRQAKA